MIYKFSKTGLAAYISHLDLMRTMQRSIRRAGIPVMYSSGFNPHMLISFASASPLGLESLAEYIEIRQDGDIEDACNVFSAALPQGLEILGREEAPEEMPAMMSALAETDYAFYTGLTADEAEKAVAALLARSEIIAERKTKKGVKSADIRPLIVSVRAEAREDGSVVFASLMAGSENNLRPEVFASALFGDTPYKTVKTECRLRCGDKLMTPFETAQAMKQI